MGNETKRGLANGFRVADTTRLRDIAPPLMPEESRTEKPERTAAVRGPCPRSEKTGEKIHGVLERHLPPKRALVLEDRQRATGQHVGAFAKALRR